jgi:hypothetical protein
MTAEAENEDIGNYDVLSETRPQILEKFFTLIDTIEKKNYAITPVVKEMVKQYKIKTEALKSAEEGKRKAEERLAKKAKGYKWYIEQHDQGRNKTKSRKGGRLKR